MSDECTHTDAIRDVTPSALGCEECLKIGSEWLHLRLCRICGHVGCCDDSPNRHATKHFHAIRHPIIEGYDPPEGWGSCYVDEALAGVEFMQSRNSKERVGARQIQAVVDFCREHGLIGAPWGRTVSGVWFAVAYGY